MFESTGKSAELRPQRQRQPPLLAGTRIPVTRWPQREARRISPADLDGGFVDNYLEKDSSNDSEERESIVAERLRRL